MKPSTINLNNIPKSFCSYFKNHFNSLKFSFHAVSHFVLLFSLRNRHEMTFSQILRFELIEYLSKDASDTCKER